MNADDDQAAIRTEVERRDMQIANLKGRCAVADYELHILSAGNGNSTFMVARWGRTLDFPDASAVAERLDRIGAR